IQHWSAGGETSLDNLLLLCSRHHVLVHEGGFRIERDYQNRWFFKRPDGRGVPSCGYRAQDTSDDSIDDNIFDLSNLINNPSAEGLLTAVKTFPAQSPPL
ncbi:MAG: HNH endonuclease signature motif containing protein, partial [Pseudomonadales bacterium]